jgi:hypothetical protein
MNMTNMQSTNLWSKELIIVHTMKWLIVTIEQEAREGNVDELIS